MKLQILKALGHSKINICNYLNSPNKYRRKPTGRAEKLSPQFKKRIVHEIKKTSSISKILKSLVDASCSTRTIRRHLIHEKINHKKRIPCPRLTKKLKEKRLEYARQYQTMSAKEWQKVIFLDEKQFNDLVGGFSSSGKFKLQFVSGRQKAVNYVKILKDLSLTQEGHHLCGEEWTFQQDNAAIHNASITKKYLLEQKIRLLDHPTCSPEKRKFMGIEFCESLLRRSTVLCNFWTQKHNLRRMGKNTFGSTLETSWS